MDRHSALIRKLAEIDQKLAAACDLCEDRTLKPHEATVVCELIESLEQCRRDLEAELRGEK